MTLDEQFDITDEAIRATFERRARRASAPDLRTSIADATAATRQRRAWAFGLRRTFGVPSGPRILVVALLSTAMVGALLGVAGGLTNRPAPTTTAPAIALEGTDPSRTSTPSRPPSSAVPGSLMSTRFDPPFAYVLLRTTDPMLHADWSATFALKGGHGNDHGRDLDGDLMPDAFGVMVAPTSGSVVHLCDALHQSSGRTAVRETPAEFLADLRTLAGIGLGPMSEMIVDGRRTLVADIDPTTSRCTFGDFHPVGSDIGGGYVPLASPSRIYLVEVDGRTVAIVAWAATKDSLDAWLPLANAFVDSIRFAPSDPRPAEWTPEPVPTPRPQGPDEAVTLSYDLRFVYAKDPAKDLVVSVDRPDVFAFVDHDLSADRDDIYGREPRGGLRSDAHGIVTTGADGTTAVGCPSVPADHVTMRRAPQNVVADLRKIAGVHVGTTSLTTVAGHPASIVALAADPTCAEAELHILDDTTAPKSLLLGIPSRLYVVELPGDTRLISIWATTDEGLAAFLPTATRLVDSIRFLDVP